MVKDAQVGVLRRKRMEGKTQEGSAAAAAMSVRSARKWQHGAYPSQRRKPHTWRTRPDRFGEVFESEVVPLLAADEKRVLEARTILGELDRRHPGEFSARHLRTLQRRIRQWRALHGPDKEVFFPQEHPPGREAAYDFTNCDELGVTIGGMPFDHLLFELVFSFSGWRWPTVALSESYEALLLGVQEALWQLGGVVEVLRSDNLSAATHELPMSGGRTLTRRYQRPARPLRTESRHESRRAKRTRMGWSSRRIGGPSRSWRRCWCCAAATTFHQWTSISAGFAK